MPHEPFQAKNFQIARALQPIVISMIEERIKRGLLEECHGPYRNPWFLVAKRNGGYRLINSATEINRITLKDACIPPNVEEFAEDFTGLSMASVLDLFSGYDQIGLAEQCRNLTGFQTPLGLLRMTTLPQGAVNSVAQFVRIITKTLRSLLRDVAKPFLDDIGVKGPRTDYGGEEAVPGVRRYVLEHIQNIDQTLLKLERAGFTISGKKMQLCMRAVEILGYVCDSDGRHPSETKVAKILAWGPCKSATDVKAFMGVVGYFRAWIPYLAEMAEPLFSLLKKGTPFIWGEHEQEAMNEVKEALAGAAALASIAYEADPESGEIGEIVVLVDASGHGWGGVLTQVQEEKRRPIRFESGLWRGAQLSYDAGKRECLALLLMLRKSRLWLYGVPFTVESDAATLVHQLSGNITDLPNALTTRWIAYIRLFDFTLRHVPGKLHGAADGLSRRGAQPGDGDRDITGEIEDLIETSIGCTSAESLVNSGSRPKMSGLSQANSAAPSRVLSEDYTEESEKIAQYLVTLQRPQDLSGREFRRFKMRALKFAVIGEHLYRREKKQVPLRRVLDQAADQQAAVSQVHDEIATHRGREATYRMLAERYWWSGMYQDVAKFVMSCKECQFRSTQRYHEPLHPTFATHLFEVVGLDCVHMKPAQGKGILVMARDSLSGWPEGRALVAANARSVAKFIWEDIICRHGCPGRIIMDGGPENKEVAEELLNRYRIRKIEISAYHPQANGMVETGHRPIKESLYKMDAAGRGDWVNNLATVLWADRTTIKGPTGMTPHQMITGEVAVLPIDLEFPTWLIHDWSAVKTTEDLLAYRAIQLSRRDCDLEEAALRLRRMRLENQETFDDEKAVREKPLEIGDTVLLFRSQDAGDRSTATQAKNRWSGPYRIHQVDSSKGNYGLAEMDGSVMRKPVAGHRLRRYHIRDATDPLQPNQAESETVAPADGPEKEDDRGLPFQAVNPAEDEEYEVEAITGHRRSGLRHGNRVLYRVRWTGYDEETEEPEESFLNSLEILNAYQEESGIPITTPEGLERAR